MPVKGRTLCPAFFVWVAHTSEVGYRNVLSRVSQIVPIPRVTK